MRAHAPPPPRSPRAQLARARTVSTSSLAPAGGHLHTRVNKDRDPARTELGRKLERSVSPDARGSLGQSLIAGRQLLCTSFGLAGRAAMAGGALKRQPSSAGKTAAAQVMALQPSWRFARQ
jgi:hypothetical protein